MHHLSNTSSLDFSYPNRCFSKIPLQIQWFLSRKPMNLWRSSSWTEKHRTTSKQFPLSNLYQSSGLDRTTQSTKMPGIFTCLVKGEWKRLLTSLIQKVSFSLKTSWRRIKFTCTCTWGQTEVKKSEISDCYLLKWQYQDTLPRYPPKIPWRSRFNGPKLGN